MANKKDGHQAENPEVKAVPLGEEKKQIGSPQASAEANQREEGKRKPLSERQQNKA